MRVGHSALPAPAMKFNRQLPQASATASAPASSTCFILISNAFCLSGAARLMRNAPAATAAPVELAGWRGFAVVHAERAQHGSKLVQYAAVPAELAGVVIGHAGWIGHGFQLQPTKIVMDRASSGPRAKVSRSITHSRG